MPTLLFVHGINVRGEAWFRSLELIAQKAAKFLPGIKVEGCQWGDAFGAYLHKDGASIPDFENTGDAAPPVEDSSRGRWFLLAENPLLELRILPEEAFFGERPGIEIFTLIPPLAANAEIIKLLAGWRIEEAWPKFIGDISVDPEWKQVVESITAAAPAVCEKLARAITAAYQQRLRLEGYPAPGGEQRDEIKDALVNLVGGPPLGIGDWFLDRLTAFGAYRRGKLTDKTTPAIGDVIRYQARGQEIRNFIEERARKTSATIVLAHSLGGVACVDWLASKEYAKGIEEGKIRKIDRLITVGSQAPYFYELDALSSRPYGAGLPEYFPSKWLNIFDRSDFLSYMAQPIFPSARDAEADNGQAFPESHSAYWHNDKQVWTPIADFIAEP
jgi:pimeloyl-ACP methyl ester carboxylesterase